MPAGTVTGLQLFMTSADWQCGRNIKAPRKGEIAPKMIARMIPFRATNGNATIQSAMEIIAR